MTMITNNNTNCVLWYNWANKHEQQWSKKREAAAQLGAWDKATDALIQEKRYKMAKIRALREMQKKQGKVNQRTLC